LRDLLPLSAILVVLISMSLVDILIIGDAVRVVSIVPMLVVLLLWGVATLRVRGRDASVR